MGIPKDIAAKRRRRTLWIILLSTPFILLLAGAVTLKILFTSERLKAMVIPRMEQATGRSVTISDIDLSVFSGLAVRIDSLAISNAKGDGFSPEPLLSLRRLVLKVRLSALFRGNLEVTTMVIEQPQLTIEVNSRGVANYADMMTAGQPAAAPAGAETAPSRDTTIGAPEGGMLLLSDMRIVNGEIRYLNRKDSSSIWVRGLDHTMRMEIEGASRNATIEGQTSIGNFSYGPPEKPLIANLRMTMDEKLEYIKDRDSLAIRKGDLSVEDIGLAVTGNVASLTGTPVIHLALQSDRVNIPDLLSLVPKEYLQRAHGMRGEGVAKVQLQVDGIVSDSTSPSVSGTIAASDATLQYAGLPKAITNIRIACGFVRSQARQELKLDQFSASLGSNPFSLSLTVVNFKDPDIALSLNAQANLSEAKDYYPLQPGTEVSGILATSLSLAGKVAHPEALRAQGSITFHKVAVKTPASATPIRDLEGTVAFNNQLIESKKLSMTLGKSDLSLGFSVKDFLSLVFPEKKSPKPVAQISLTSRHLLTSDIMSDTGGPAQAPPKAAPAAEGPRTAPAAAPRGGLPLPDADLTVTASIGTLTMERFEFTNVRASLHVENGLVTMQGFSMNGFDGTATARGTLNMQKPERPSFDLAMEFSNTDAHALLGKFSSFGERVNGRLTMNTTMKGMLDDTLGLVPKSLNGQGHVRMTNGKLTGVKVNKAVADILKLPDLENVAFKDWANDFSVSEGRLVIKDLKISALDADYLVNGSQGLDGSLDYEMTLLLPQKTSSRVSVPGFGGEAINLFKDASGRVKLDFKVGGTTDHPEAALDTQPALRRAGELAKQKASEEAKKVQDQVKKKAEDALKNLFKKKK